MIMPAVMKIMTKKAGPHRMGRVMGILGVPMLIAPIIGPILGGWLVDDVSWRWIFFINLPIGILAFVLGMVVRNASSTPAALHVVATVTGGLAMVLGLFLQMISATRNERIVIVTGMIAGFVGACLGLAAGGIVG